MTFTIIDPIDTATILAQKIADSGQSLRLLWTEDYRQHSARGELSGPLIEHIDLKPGLSPSEIGVNVDFNNAGIILAGSYPGILLAQKWRDEQQAQSSVLAPERWIDKIVFDQALQTKAAQYALNVVRADLLDAVSERHILRRTRSRGVGSARWAQFELAGATQADSQDCAHVYLEGDAFFCNGVQFADGLAVTDVWRCFDKRFGTRQLLCGVGPINAGHSSYQKIVSAVEYVSAALALPVGPFHAEGIVCPDGSIRLLKLLPKLAGFPLPKLTELMGCINQPTLTATEWASNFAKKPISLPKPTSFASDFAFPCDQSGCLKALNGMDKIENLKSFQSYVLRCAPGDNMSMSVDEVSYPQVIILQHTDAQQLDADLAICTAHLLTDIYQFS